MYQTQQHLPFNEQTVSKQNVSQLVGKLFESEVQHDFEIRGEQILPSNSFEDHVNKTDVLTPNFRIQCKVLTRHVDYLRILNSMPFNKRKSKVLVYRKMASFLPTPVVENTYSIMEYQDFLKVLDTLFSLRKQCKEMFRLLPEEYKQMFVHLQ